MNIKKNCSFLLKLACVLGMASCSPFEEVVKLDREPLNREHVVQNANAGSQVSSLGNSSNERIITSLNPDPSLQLKVQSGVYLQEGKTQTSRNGRYILKTSPSVE